MHDDRERLFDCERVNIEKLGIFNSDHIRFFEEFKDVCANLSPWYFRDFMGYNWFRELLIVFIKIGAAVT